VYLTHWHAGSALTSRHTWSAEFLGWDIHVSMHFVQAVGWLFVRKSWLELFGLFGNIISLDFTGSRNNHLSLCYTFSFH